MLDGGGFPIEEDGITKRRRKEEGVERKEERGRWKEESGRRTF